MPILSYGLTDIGQKRSTNQDAIFLDPQHHLYLVADGMGGHKGGDIAGLTAAEMIPQEFRKMMGELPPTENLKHSLQCAHKKIQEKAKSEEKLKGMGTTAVCAHFFNNELFLANVGDSRCYLYHNEYLYQLSRDHSIVQEKLNIGFYNQEEANQDPQKNFISRALGQDDSLDIDVFNYQVCQNDLFLLCSDGLYGMISDEDLHFLIQKSLGPLKKIQEKDIKKLTHELVDLSNVRGGKDNISAIMLLASPS